MHASILAMFRTRNHKSTVKNRIHAARICCMRQHAGRDVFGFELDSGRHGWRFCCGCRLRHGLAVRFSFHGFLVCETFFAHPDKDGAPTWILALALYPDAILQVLREHREAKQ